MGDPQTRRIVAAHRTAIEEFRRVPFSRTEDVGRVRDLPAESVTDVDQGAFDASLQSRVTPTILTVDALTVPNLRYVFVGEMSQNVCTGAPMITLTVSATNTSTGEGQPVPDDVTKWLPLILGERLMPHTTDRGNHPNRTRTATLRTFTVGSLPPDTNPFPELTPR